MKLQLIYVACLQLCNALSLWKASARGLKQDDTRLTDLLNSHLETGLVVRKRDDGTNAAHVPAVFWSNQIITPNSFFLYNTKLKKIEVDLPAIGFVADPHKFNAGNLWGDHGVTMYGHDANACDDNSERGRGFGEYGRCTWLPSVGFDDGRHEYWECPGGQIDATNTSFSKDSKIQGAGNYGCRGCSFSQRTNELLDKGLPPFWENCQCPCLDYASCNDFAKKDLRKIINSFPHSEKDGWFGYDSHSCWVTNPDALAGIQNGLYQTRSMEDAEMNYWGWNEVAVKKEINEPHYWITHVIFVPAWLTATSKEGFDENTIQYLGGLIQQLVDNQEILPGKDKIGQKPGSDVVFVAEIHRGTGDEYKKHFFCMQQTLANFVVCSVSQADDPNQHGYCYIAYATTGCNGEVLRKEQTSPDPIHAPNSSNASTQRSLRKTSQKKANSN